MSNELVPSYARYTDENYVDKKVTWENLPDKPFYSEVKDVFIYETQETEVGYVGSSGVKPAMFTRLGFKVGKIYKIIWNGMEYTCEAFEASMEGATGIGVGNIAVAGGENTGEPFIIADLVGEAFGIVIDLTASSSNTATVGVITEKEVVVKIPEKFLPEQKENLSEFNNDLYGEQYTLENVVPEGVYTFVREDSYYVCSGHNDVNNIPVMGFAFYEGVEAIVTFDGVKYKLNPSVKIKDAGTDLESENYYAIGNLSLIDAGENTGEPFVVSGTPMDGFGFITLLPDATHTIKVDGIVGTEIKRIPKEYLPDSVDYIIMNSSTEGSTKQFKITIGDDGVLVASEL